MSTLEGQDRQLHANDLGACDRADIKLVLPLICCVIINKLPELSVTPFTRIKVTEHEKYVVWKFLMIMQQYIRALRTVSGTAWRARAKSWQCAGALLRNHIF